MIEVKDYIFNRHSDGRIKIRSSVIQSMLPFVQNKYYKKEAGGVLLGRHLLHSNDVIVDKVTFPQKKDKRSRFMFWRSKFHHQKLIEQYWYESECTITYIGEWHTHPEALPTPSSTDYHGWRRTLRKAKFHTDNLFFLILGIEEITLLEGNKTTRTILKLDLTHE